MPKKKRKRSKRRRSNTKPDALAAEAYSIEPDEIVFEEEPSDTDLIFQDCSTLLYGRPKIGKTTLGSSFDGVYFLPTEPGYLSKKIRKTPINNWVTFKKFVEFAEKHPKMVDRVKMWCVDTADILSKFCMQYTCGRAGIAHPTDQEWGKGWEDFRDEFTHWVLRLMVLPPGTLFISHETDREVISRSFKITRSTPALPSTTYKILNGACDIIAQMAYAPGKRPRKGADMPMSRCLYFKPTETRDAGDRTGLLPDIIKFKTEKTAVRKIVECFV